jgi:hypothetical protein
MDGLVDLGTNASYFYPVYIVLKALTLASLEGHDFFLKQVLCWYLSYCWEMFSSLKLLNLQELQCRTKLLRWFVFLFAPVIQYEVNTFDLTRLTRIRLDAFFSFAKQLIEYVAFSFLPSILCMYTYTFKEYIEILLVT